VGRSIISIPRAEQRCGELLKELARAPDGGDWSIHIPKVSDDGSFEGTVTFTGANFRGDNMPMKGTYNGADLIIYIPNLGTCGKSTATLHRGGSEHMFDGTMSHSAGIKEFLDPQ
jgi:hypothetical protein